MQDSAQPRRVVAETRRQGAREAEAEQEPQEAAVLPRVVALQAAMSLAARAPLEQRVARAAAEPARRLPAP